MTVSKTTGVSILMAALLATSALGGLANMSTTVNAAQMISASQRQETTGFADLVARTRPAVVSVLVKKSVRPGKAMEQQLPEGLDKFFKRFGMPDGMGQQFKAPQNDHPSNQMVMGQGSGFFITNDGYIVTNNHVVSDADSIKVRMNDGKELKAKLVGADPKTDLAVIKVEGKGFAHVKFGNSDKTRVGDWVVAVGNPFGLRGTTTAGIVSARGRDIGSGPYDDFIQIDASINRGNSGGPTFNEKGDVIGVNTAIYSPSGGSVGIGFAIPSNIAKKVVASLISDGTVHRGWLGISIQPVTKDLADSLGMKETKGALVASVNENSPAEKGGLVPGDVITAVDGTLIKSPRDLSMLIASKGPGANVSMQLWRNGKSIVDRVALQEMPGSRPLAATAKTKEAKTRLGLTLKNTDNGVVIASVLPNSPAAEKGLKAGDMIEKIGGKDVKTVNDVREAIAHLSDKNHGRVLMLLKTGQGNRFVALKLDKSTG